jgi:hypothetical protein
MSHKERRQIPPHKRTPPPCPDCGQAFNREKQLIHLDTCPLGLAIDAETADDADWFTAHPEAGERHRPLFRQEAASLREMWQIPTNAVMAGPVVVKQLAPGIRVRSFAAVVALVPNGGGS